MVMPRKRPLLDPTQYYAYVWRLNGEVIWVGQGKDNRGRPTARACWNGRPDALRRVLQDWCREIEWRVFACESKDRSVDLERKLIRLLKPKYNTAPQKGGWKGMHTEAGLKRIAAASTGNPVTDAQREARRENARKMNERKYGNASQVS